MDALVALTAAHLETFVLVFCRLGGMMVWAPVLGHRSIPVPHRAGLAALLGLLITTVVGGAPRGSAGDAVALVGAVAGEALVGLAIGFVAHLIVAAVHVAGEMAGMQMGLGIASVFDPAAGEQTAPMEPPEPRWILLFTLGYALLIGPANWLAFRALGRERWLWVSTPAIAAGW